MTFNVDRRLGHKLDKSGGSVSGSLTVSDSLVVNGTNFFDIVPTGAVLPFAGSAPPSLYLICDGSAISRSTYSKLFQVIGTAYGIGDGSTTFNLPDLRWMFLRGAGPHISTTGSGTANSVLNQATFTGHGFNRTGIKVRLGSGTLSGLSTLIDYWVIVVDQNTLAFAVSKSNAMSGSRIAISGANSAQINQYEDPDAPFRVSSGVGGNATTNVGSYEDDGFESHSHTVGIANVAAAGPYIGAFYGSTQAATSSVGINETRPSNVYVNYIIKF